MGDCNDIEKPVPCYFNTGCCKYADGDITGMELLDGELRLVKWSARESGQGFVRTVLENGSLQEIFRSL